jgi:hypothetical protein
MTPWMRFAAFQILPDNLRPDTGSLEPPADALYEPRFRQL